MRTIKLPNGVYSFDANQPLGARGGFGQVFRGRDSDGNAVAVKELHLKGAEHAHRELDIAKLLTARSCEHVLDILDSGQCAENGNFYIVMPIATTNLESFAKEQLSADAVAQIMLQIVSGLIEVNDIVHRDLKPDNILFHEGKWKIADFGIARLTQAATAKLTVRDFLTADYAAPEQWKGERCTNATDIYALGCIGHRLVSGEPPFAGDRENGHLYGSPPPLACADPRLESVISLLLRKNPQTRPQPTRVRQLLQAIADKPHNPIKDGALGLLASAGLKANREAEEAEAKQRLIQEAAATRNDLATEAYEILQGNVERLWGKIHEHVPAAVRSSSGRSKLECCVGQAKLHISWFNNAVPTNTFSMSKWDVIAEAKVHVQSKSYMYKAALWYVKRPKDDEYRWREVTYSTWLGQSSIRTIDVDYRDADYAASNITSGYNIDFGPAIIDDEMEEVFHDRWLWLFAQAADGQLNFNTHPPVPQQL